MHLETAAYECKNMSISRCRSHLTISRRSRCSSGASIYDKLTRLISNGDEKVRSGDSWWSSSGMTHSHMVVQRPRARKAVQGGGQHVLGKCPLKFHPSLPRQHVAIQVARDHEYTCPAQRVHNLALCEKQAVDQRRKTMQVRLRSERKEQ